jgi:hypothetical protein
MSCRDEEGLASGLALARAEKANPDGAHRVDIERG